MHDSAFVRVDIYKFHMLFLTLDISFTFDLGTMNNITNRLVESPEPANLSPPKPTFRKKSQVEIVRVTRIHFVATTTCFYK